MKSNEQLHFGLACLIQGREWSGERETSIVNVTTRHNTPFKKRGRIVLPVRSLNASESRQCMKGAWRRGRLSSQLFVGHCKKEGGCVTNRNSLLWINLIMPALTEGSYVEG